MILTYLAEVTAPGYRPGSDDRVLAKQRVATLRLYFWADLGVGRTPVEQALRTKDPIHRDRLERLITILMPERPVPEHLRGVVEPRVEELTRLHADPEDCRIVAEAECVGVETLVTFDKRLQKRLQDEATVRLRSPEEYWDDLAVPRGAPPNLTPHATNWLSAESFWRWD